MHIIRSLILKLVSLNIHLTAKHIPGKTNILADKISRFQVTPQLLSAYGMETTPTTPFARQLHDTMRRDLGLAQAANTKQKYKHYWEQFKSFMTDKLQARYKPASQQHLAWYVTYLHNNLQLKASSIRPHLSAIAYYHQLAGLNSPTDSFLVSQLLAGYKKHDPATRVRKPIT